ncbi:MAG: molybdopterin cofactor-binding domain-containing protein, partial [Pseudomonadota bacterium]|nr:molybdopterin cofactor-binding domain-containing protein [Pseudomonadota bacterium]
LGGVLCRCTGYSKIIDAVMQAHAHQPPSIKPDAGHNVGSSIQHLDGVAKVQAGLNYGADSVLADALSLRVIRSPHHYADFEIGDKSAFLADHPGIVAVFDATDVPGRNCFGVIPPFADQPVFAERTALYRGEAVAAIVGEPAVIEGFDEAEFPISWQPHETMLTPQDARKPEARQLHAGRDGNILVKGYVARGDADAALARAAHRVSVHSSTPFIEHAYIEPEAGYAVREGNRLVIYGCTQAAQMDRDSLAEIMALEVDAIRVMPSACGGGFGSKLDISFQPFVALAAWVLHRPVAICYTRGESMRSSTKRHPSDIRLEVGCDAEGRISGFVFDGVFNTGAYASWGPTVANRVPVHASGPYVTPDYRASSVAVHTNAPPAGAFRGFGVPQSAVAQECAYDLLAEKLDMDRLAFRRMNALQNNMPTVTGQCFSTGVGIADCLAALQPEWDAALARADRFNKDAAKTGSMLRKGIGVASCWYGCGNTSLPNPSTMRIGVTADGACVLHQGAMDIGQGANTVISQIAADALGVPVHSLSLIDGDTDRTPDCGKTSASRQTFVSGKAALLAGRALREVILRHGNVSDDASIVIDGAEVRLVDNAAGGTASIDLSSLPVNAHGYVFMAEETYDPPTTPLDENGQGAPYAVYGYGAQMIELVVDIGLGQVRLEKMTTAHDVGRAINPLLVEGQIEGGAAQGIGLALMEDYLPGRTENLHDYLIPTIGDVPLFEHVIVEVADAEGPYGAKGLGEHVLIPTAPAIVNAIRQATGVLITHLPATADKIRAALHQQVQETKS